MRTALLLAVVIVPGLAGCGGGGSMASSGPPPSNAFTGTLSITGALPAGTTTCVATHTVTFSGTGVSLQSVAAAGGECLAFVNGDAVNSHQPATHGSPACVELDAPAALAPGQTFTTPPLAGPKTCYWEDLLTPPGTPGY